MSLLPLLGLAGCLTLEPLPERARTEYGAFPDELYRIWEDELGRSEPAAVAPARVERLRELSPDLRWALGQAIRGRVGARPGGVLDLFSSAPALTWWDDGQATELLDATSRLLELAEQQDPLPEGAAALLAAPGGTDPEAPWRLLHWLTRQPVPLLQEAGGLLVEHEGELARLHDQLGERLRQPDPPDPATDRDAAAPLVGHTLEALLLTDGCASLARPSGVDPDEERPPPDCSDRGALTPYDACRCELADWHGPNEARTVLLDEDGQPQTRLGFGGLPEPRTVELKDSLLGLLAVVGRELLAQEAGDPATALGVQLLEILPALLGPVRTTPAGAHYHAASQSPVVGLLRGGLELLRYPELSELLDALAELAGRDPAVLENLLPELGHAARILRESGTILAEHSNFVDDLLGDNPFLALGPGSPCDPAVASPCFAPSWLTCAGSPPTCQPRAPDQPAPGLLGLLAQEEELLRDLLAAAAARDPRQPELPDRTSLFTAFPYAGATLMERLGTAAADDPALPLQRGQCPAYVDPLDAELRGIMPSELLTSAWLGLVDHSLDDRPLPGARLDRYPGRSAFQNLLSLIYNTSRLEYRGRIQFDLSGSLIQFEIPIRNVAAFYLDSTVGLAYIHSIYPTKVMEHAVVTYLCELLQEREPGPIDLLRPTSEQLNLFILRDHSGANDVGDVIDHELLPSRLHHAEQLVAFAAPVEDATGACQSLRDRLGPEFPADQCPSAVDALAPLIRVFASHGLHGSDRRDMDAYSSGGTQLFLDLLSTFHLHWGTYQQCVGQSLREDQALTGVGCPYGADGLYQFDRQDGSGLRRLEPVFGRLVRETRLFPRLFELLASAEANGVNDQLVPFLRWLLERDPGGGADWPLDPPLAGVRRGDRQSRDPHPARLYLLLEPLRRLSQALDEPQHQAALARWEELELARLLAGTPEGTPTPGSRALVQLLREGLVAAPGLFRTVAPTPEEQQRWVDGLQQDVTSLVALLEHPLVWQLLQLWESLAEEPGDGRQWLLELVTGLLSDPGPAEADGLGPLLQTLVHLGRLRITPAQWEQLRQGAGELLEPGRRPLLGLIRSTACLGQTDPTGLLAELAGNLAQPRTGPDGPRVPLRSLADGLAQTLRADPRSQDALTAHDLHWILRKFQRYISDPVHGLGRLAEIVSQRLGIDHPPPVDPAQRCIFVRR